MFQAWSHTLAYGEGEILKKILVRIYVIHSSGTWSRGRGVGGGGSAVPGYVGHTLVLRRQAIDALHTCRYS